MVVLACEKQPLQFEIWALTMVVFLINLGGGGIGRGICKSCELWMWLGGVFGDKEGKRVTFRRLVLATHLKCKSKIDHSGSGSTFRPRSPKISPFPRKKQPIITTKIFSISYLEFCSLKSNSAWYLRTNQVLLHRQI